MVSSPDERLASAVLAADVPQVLAALAAGASPDAMTPGGWPVLVAAAADGDDDAVAALLDGGARVDDRRAGHTALHAAAATDRLDAVAVLLAAGADPRGTDANGRTPLHLAVIEASPGMVTRLIDAAPDAVGLVDDIGRTPLHDAAVRRDPDVVRLLVSAGADPDARDASGSRPVDLGG